MSGLAITDLSRSVLGEKRPVTVVAPWTTHLRSGECLALTGPYDAGPRAALRLLVGLDSRSSGTVSLTENGARELPQETDTLAWRRQVLYVPALIHLIKTAPHELMARLRRMHQRTFRLSQEPTREGDTLCVALELALELQPSVLLLDTGALLQDLGVRSRVVAALRTFLEGGNSAILVGQDERLLALVAHRVEVWLDGHVVGVGSPEELLGAAMEECRREGLA